jgi:hypothetical protein
VPGIASEWLPGSAPGQHRCLRDRRLAVKRRDRAALFVVAAAWATAALPMVSGAARADQLCLDRANNFVPCPPPAGPVPAAGDLRAPTKPLPPPATTAANPAAPGAGLSGTLLPPRRPSPAHSGNTDTLLILGVAALMASATTLAARRLIVHRSLHRTQQPETAVSEPMPSKLEVYQLTATPASTVPPTTNGTKPPATAITAHSATPQNNHRRAPPPPQSPSRSQMPPTPSEKPPLVPEMAWSGAGPTHVGSISTGSSPSLPDPSPAAEPPVVSRADEHGDIANKPLPSPAGPIRLHQLTVDSLAQLAKKLDALDAHDADVILALPAGAALVLGEAEELIQAAQLVDGICVAASPVRLASPALAEQLRRAIEDGGDRVTRGQCFPHALIGPAAQLRSLLAELPGGDTDADRLTAAILTNRHEMVLDTVSFFFHVLDGTGTDVAIVAGRAHVAGKQPLVLIDASPGGLALASAEIDLADRGAGDLACLLRYDGAAAPRGEVTLAAPDVRVTQLWLPSFCATVIRAAEVAGLWSSVAGSTTRVGVPLLELIPRLAAHLETDMAHRIWPLLDEWQPSAGMTLNAATVIRQHVGWSKQREVAPHILTHLVASVRLNDEYTGGALVLPRQRWEDSAVPVGALALWPSADSHPHHLAPITSGVKYTLRLWLRLAAT